MAAHLEHILCKLGAPTRTLAAVRAEREGLYVPAPAAAGVHESAPGRDLGLASLPRFGARIGSAQGLGAEGVPSGDGDIGRSTDAHAG
ncbi:hypothetical protein [Blastococcus brunescens]|uniref:Uncharacterized protein n=1 Tax=Blastococcus brunescens TaxID=1564165 RepID=A0ABZ1AV65_9ACTN|nr:hypothetical protein [Blastococcus sp. BMG 8361]WRL61821.1 hypothetical protein U6N30_17005 [Blastococcus sp. BMG 8361]